MRFGVITSSETTIVFPTPPRHALYLFPLRPYITQLSLWQLLIPGPFDPRKFTLPTLTIFFLFSSFMPGGSPLSIIIPLSEAKKNNLNSRELTSTCRLKAVGVYKGMWGSKVFCVFGVLDRLCHKIIHKASTELNNKLCFAPLGYQKMSIYSIFNGCQTHLPHFRHTFMANIFPIIPTDGRHFLLHTELRWCWYCTLALARLSVCNVCRIQRHIPAERKVRGYFCHFPQIQGSAWSPFTHNHPRLRLGIFFFF